MGNYFSTLKWNWKNRKRMTKIHYMSKKKQTTAISVPRVLDFMRDTLLEKTQFDDFGIIYNEYFK